MFTGSISATTRRLVGQILTFVYGNGGITALYLTGVCTDICILHTAVDAYNLGYRLFIFKDAVASFDPVGHEWALRHFEQTLGATIL